MMVFHFKSSLSIAVFFFCITTMLSSMMTFIDGFSIPTIDVMTTTAAAAVRAGARTTTHRRTRTTTTTKASTATTTITPSSYYRTVSLLAAKKGFGNTTPSTPPKKSKQQQQRPVPSPDVTTTTKKPSSDVVVNEDGEIVDPLSATPYINNPFAAATGGYSSGGQVDTSQGKVALDRLRRDRAEKRNEELQKIREVRMADELVRESPEAAVIPEKVAQRMGKRMLPFVGVPLLGGMGAFVGFWYMATYRDMEFQPALVAASTIGLLAIGLLGITYSIMSASWDPDREGSLLGTDEFSQNVDNIRSGLSRSRENVVLRERMASSAFSDDELDGTTTTSSSSSKKGLSFQEKLGEELDN